MQYPKDVRLVEVGPRDGLQNEPMNTSVEFRVELVNRLSICGFETIEVGSFVSPEWVSQMAATDEVLARVTRRSHVSLVALVPNLVGLNAAIAASVDEVAIFTATTETFCHKNTNCSIKESLQRFQPVLKKAQERSISVRGYISCVVGCPYEGAVNTRQVVPIVEALLDLGCYEISLGDTIGVGTTHTIRELIDAVSQLASLDKFAIHFHDTYGQALPNILVALDRGISVIDSSVGGLGGCPYAKGANGNVATEDVIYMLDGMGVNTGIALDDVVDVSKFVFSYLNKHPASRVTSARL